MASGSHAVGARQWKHLSRASQRNRLPMYSAQLVMVLVAFGSMELISRLDTDALPESLFPPPSRVLETGFHEVQRARYWEALHGTLQGWAYGLAAAVAVAVPLGLALGRSQLLWDALRLTVDILRPLPSIALLPLLVLVIGLNLELKIWIIAYAAVWPILIQTVYGAQDIDVVAWDMAHAYRLRRRDRILRIVVPSAMPYIGTGLRISAIVALNVGIAEELIVGSQTALGQEIFKAQIGGQTSLLYVFVVTTGILGLLINGTFRRIELYLLRWHPAERGDLA